MTMDGDLYEVLNRSASEADFQSQLRSVALARGWLYYHTYNSRRSDPGFPDAVLVRDDRLIFAELKSIKHRRQKPTARQQIWLDALRLIPGIEVYLWYTDDIDQIEEVLR